MNCSLDIKILSIKVANEFQEQFKMSQAIPPPTPSDGYASHAATQRQIIITDAKLNIEMRARELKAMQKEREMMLSNDYCEPTADDQAAEREEKATNKRAATAARVEVERLVRIDRIASEREARETIKAAACAETARVREARAVDAAGKRDEKLAEKQLDATRIAQGREDRRMRDEALTRERTARMEEAIRCRQRRETAMILAEQEKRTKAEKAATAKEENEKRLKDERVAKRAKTQTEKEERMKTERERITAGREGRVQRDEAMKDATIKARVAKDEEKRAKRQAEVERMAVERQKRLDRDHAKSMELARMRETRTAARADGDEARLAALTAAKIEEATSVKGLEKSLEDVYKKIKSADRLYDELKKTADDARRDCRRTRGGDALLAAKSVLEEAVKVADDQGDVINDLFEKQRDIETRLAAARRAVMVASGVVQ